MNRLTIEECQSVELSILEKVSDICEQLHLRYYLFYGTLIGAVRHSGFIPWDDDLDIIMPRPDYTKLMEFFEKNQKALAPLKAVYQWHYYKYSYAMARITDMTYKLHYTDDGPFSNEDMGLFIDVYPFDGAGNDKKSALKLSKKSIDAEDWVDRSVRTKRPNDEAAKLKNYIRPFLYKYAHVVGEEHYQKNLMKYTTAYEYDSSKYIGPLTWHRGVYIFERSLLDPAVKLNFCGKKFNVPKDFDTCLRDNYGDYMQLPPENERVATHYYDAYLRSDWDKIHS